MALKGIKVENQSSFKENKEERNLVEVKNKKKKFNFEDLQKYLKEITLVVIAVALIGVGYSNYKPEESMQVASYQNEKSLGDAELVSSNAIVENDETINSVSNVENINSVASSIVDNNTITQQTSTEQDYFSETKLERDTMYSQTLETYQKMIDNEKLTNEQKAIAMQEVSKITEEKNAIQIAENLIKNKGYENVVILKNSENVNVIVKAKKLETEDVAKIQNIITRELNVDLSKINISCR